MSLYIDVPSFLIGAVLGVLVEFILLLVLSDWSPNS